MIRQMGHLSRTFINREILYFHFRDYLNEFKNEFDKVIEKKFR